MSKLIIILITLFDTILFLTSSISIISIFLLVIGISKVIPVFLLISIFVVAILLYEIHKGILLYINNHN
jgi:hypothetical protein